MGVQVLKKIAGPKIDNLGSIKGQNEVLGYYLVQNELVFGDRKLLYLVADDG